MHEGKQAGHSASATTVGGERRPLEGRGWDTGVGVVDCMLGACLLVFNARNTSVRVAPYAFT